VRHVDQFAGEGKEAVHHAGKKKAREKKGEKTLFWANSKLEERGGSLGKT